MNFFAHLKESVDMLVKHLVNWEEGDLLVFLISCVDQLWDFLVLLISVHSLEIKILGRWKKLWI